MASVADALEDRIAPTAPPKAAAVMKAATTRRMTNPLFVRFGDNLAEILRLVGVKIL